MKQRPTTKGQPPHRLWHAIAAAEALTALGTGAEGLSDHEAAARRARYGANRLPRPRRPGLALVYLKQFASPLIYLLLAAAAVSLLLGEFMDTAFIFAVLQFNALIGTIQEWKAETSAAALQSAVRTWAVALRAGRPRRLDGVELVPGDVVLLESGAQVPADMRLVAAQDLQVDESLLTGESLPVEKDADAVLPEQTPLSDRRNLIFAGTTVPRGRARGVVVRTGLVTEVGRIAQALTSGPRAAPALIVRMRRFARIIAYTVLVAIVLLAAAELARGTPITEIFFIAVALAVAAIPEGLPVAITVALSGATSRMARRNVVVRLLPAVEGLGSCTLIASDKTGTLTCNELTVRRLFLPETGEVEVSGEGYRPLGELTRGGAPLDEAARARARRLAVSGALCNEASYHLGDDGRVQHLGDTVDVAYLALAGKLGLVREALLADEPQVGQVPFESQRRYAASFHQRDGAIVAHVKGAAETILPMCRGADRAAVADAVERLAESGYRVLAVASGPVATATGLPGGSDGEAAQRTLADLDFLGLVGLIDPLRAEVPDAIRRATAAGVTVCMITGDHPTTALAIGRELGMAQAPDDVVTGAEVAEARDNPAALEALIARGRIFARVEPVQKLTIVQAMQRAGHFVAVTGDGVNDAPALAAANIGVAMGQSGTDVARGAADLILTDDNFASIVAGIEEGRVAYDNVRKVIYFLLSTGAAELVLFFLALVSGLPLPLFAVQLLWLNLVTNGVQVVTLAIEKAEPGVLKRPPRPPRQPIFDRRMIEQTVLSGMVIAGVAFGFYSWALGQGWSLFDARNGALLLMVLFENVHTFNCRSEARSILRTPIRDNPFLVLGVIAAQGAHIGAMYLPGLRDVLGVAPVSFARWGTIAAIALVLLVVMELYKLIRPVPQGYRPFGRGG